MIEQKAGGCLLSVLFYRVVHPSDVIPFICLAPIRNAANTRVSGPCKAGKLKKTTITLRKVPSMVKLGRHFCVDSVKGGKNF